mmetsp:Transcript_1567/g.3231  ORF Transcript_1567/g.3231 Transcript_1567/m.3231 type:complete len:430 (-) Transcript_1567:93-1382(-)
MSNVRAHGSDSQAEGATSADQQQTSACSVNEQCNPVGSGTGELLRLPQIKTRGRLAEPRAECHKQVAEATGSCHESGCHSARPRLDKVSADAMSCGPSVAVSARHQQSVPRGAVLRSVGGSKSSSGSGVGRSGSSGGATRSRAGSNSSTSAVEVQSSEKASPLPSLLSSIGRWRRRAPKWPPQEMKDTSHRHCRSMSKTGEQDTTEECLDLSMTRWSPPESKRAEAEVSCTGPLAAFTKLKIGELLDVVGIGPDSSAVRDRWAALPEHGLLAREVFERYCVDNGRLGAPELLWLLRDYGIMLDYDGACRILSTVTDRGERQIDFDGFSRIVAEAGTPHHGYTHEVFILLKGVFNSYDKNKSGLLERQEWLRLLQDASHGVDAAEETTQLISSCRQGGVGPLTFQQFLVLMQNLNLLDASREEEDDTLLV